MQEKTVLAATDPSRCTQGMAKPRALWVFAHPAHDSLNRSLAADGIETLSKEYDVTLVDLYAEKWNPVLHDNQASPGNTFGSRLRSQQVDDELPLDVARQQGLVEDASLLVVQFPLWWYGLPAILKGWFDRVFANGFAFGIKDAIGNTLKYGDGNLSGKRALAIVTAGDRPSSFTAAGINGHIDWLLFPLLHGTFFYTGMRPLRPHLIAGVDRPRWDELPNERDRLRARIVSITAEEPMRYRTLDSGDYDANGTLASDGRPFSLDSHRADT